MKWFAVAVLLLSGCAYHSPVAPSPAPVPIVVTPQSPSPTPASVVPPFVTTVDITPTPYNPLTGEAVSFVVLASGGTAPFNYEWNFGDGVIVGGSDTSRTHTYHSDGVKLIRVTITDAQARTWSGTREIQVRREPDPIVVQPPPVVVPPPPPPPTLPPALAVVLTCTPLLHGTPTPCNVNATYGGAQLPATAITNVDWNWGDGLTTVGAGVVATHTYATTGSYFVFATATANTADGVKTSTISKSISVP